MSSHAATSIFTEHKTKILFILLTTFIGLPVIMFMIVAAKGFMTQASNARPEDVVAMSITKSSTSISWVTSKNTQGVVEYGTSPTAFIFYGPEVEPKKEHSVPLTLLTPATTYYFRLNIDGVLYDNDGVPWTFTTKTKDGTDVAEAVKGISTTNFSTLVATEEAKVGIVTDNCVYTSCLEIQAHLGTECKSTDWLKCISAPQISDVAVVTLTPTPTPAIIMSNKCKMVSLERQYGKDCRYWTWSSYETHKETECRDAFHQYVFQCSSKSFTSTNTDEVGKTYFDDTITNRKTTSVQLESIPAEDSTVYCQIRVEDSQYNGSQWVQANAECKYTP
ncbi:MAG: hypothetical protein Q8P72_05250 [Candidatus Roizmanbacteria bacterium]|nr:hypothetical protein [Candidatus Roizmanbacteria bacterium]